MNRKNEEEEQNTQSVAVTANIKQSELVKAKEIEVSTGLTIERLEEQIKLLKAEKENAINESTCLKKTLEINSQQLDNARNVAATLEEEVAENEQCIDIIQRLLAAHESRLIKADKQIQFVKEVSTAREFQHQSYIASLSSLVQDQHNELVKLRMQKQLISTGTQTGIDGLTEEDVNENKDYNKHCSLEAQKAAHVIPKTQLSTMITKRVHPEAEEIVQVSPSTQLSTNVITSVAKGVHPEDQKVVQYMPPKLQSTNTLRIVKKGVHPETRKASRIMLSTKIVNIVEKHIKELRVDKVLSPILSTNNTAVKVIAKVFNQLSSLQSKVKMDDKDIELGLTKTSTSNDTVVGETVNINLDADAGTPPLVTIKKVATNAKKENNLNSQKPLFKKESFSDVLTKNIQLVLAKTSTSNGTARETVNTNLKEAAGTSNPPLATSPSITAKQVATNEKKEHHSSSQKSLSNKSSYSDVLTKDTQVGFPSISSSLTSTVGTTVNINLEATAVTNNPPLATSPSMTVKQVVTNEKKEHHHNTLKSFSKKRSYSDVLSKVGFPLTISSSTSTVEKTVSTNLAADAGTSNYPPFSTSSSITVNQVATNEKKEHHSNTHSTKKSYSDALIKEIQVGFPSTVSSSTSTVEKTVNINLDGDAGTSNYPPLTTSPSMTAKQVATNEKKEHIPNTPKSLSKKMSYSDVLKSTSTIECNRRKSNGCQQVNTSFINTYTRQKSNSGKRNNPKQQYKRCRETTRKGR